MTDVTYRQAINAALADALEADQQVFVFGEDVAAAGGAFKTTEGLYERFGGNRVRDSPISEQAIIGTAIGSALRGLRPVAEIMFADFAAVCFDGIANELAKYRYMTGGQVSLPVTIRMASGATGGFGAQHSQTTENWFLNVPGLKIAVPATPTDAYRLLRAAIEDPDPVLYFEHKGLFNVKGELDREAGLGLGVAEVVREGTDVTVVTTQLMRHRALEAAELLAQDAISVEVIDLRTLVPLDLGAVADSIERTNHLVVAQECSKSGSWGATVVACLMDDRFEALDAPPLMVSGDETPIPYAAALEDAWVPSRERIAAAVRSTLEY